jgi:hypothetical protein
VPSLYFHYPGQSVSVFSSLFFQPALSPLYTVYNVYISGRDRRLETSFICYKPPHAAPMPGSLSKIMLKKEYTLKMVSMLFLNHLKEVNLYYNTLSYVRSDRAGLLNGPWKP